MIEIISGLFINSAILISSVSIASIFASVKNFKIDSRITEVILTGIFAGILGCILMLYSIRLSNNLIIDFRIITIILVAIHYSYSASIISACAISVYRIAFFGPGPSSISGIIVILVVVIALYFITKGSISLRKQWTIVLGIVFITAFVSFAGILEPETLFLVIIPYYSGLTLLSIILYHLLTHFSVRNNAYAQMAKDIGTDYLTGLISARKFNSLLMNYYTESVLGERTISLLFVDVDGFKSINDTYGHLEGDIILKRIANILLRVCGANDIIARRSGDEFIVLLLESNNTSAALIAESIKNTVSNEFFGPIVTSPVSVSIGFSTYDSHIKSVTELEDVADKAMYEDKKNSAHNIT